MKNFAYRRPGNVSEAISAGSAAGVTFIAGGTDVLPLLKEDLIAPDTLVTLDSLTELQGVSVVGSGPSQGSLRIGALTTLAEIAAHPYIREHYAVLAEAAGLAASPQLRNMGTIGGNLGQQNRCWYYRSEVPCLLKGGDTCPARSGDNRFHAIFSDTACVAVHPSDPAPALVALDAVVELRGPKGDRAMPVADLLRAPDKQHPTHNVLQPGELITAVLLPAPHAGDVSTYHKAMDRAVWAFALVSAAVRLRISGGKVIDARIVLGGVAATPYRASSAEALLVEKTLTPELVAKAAAAAVEGAKPLAHNGYKVDLVRGVLTSTLSRLLS